MRINLSNLKKGIPSTFYSNHIKGFAGEYELSIKEATVYVSTGKQGLKSFAEYLKNIGYLVESYWLEPNKDLFRDVGDDWQAFSRTSPSYGLVIPDNDPKLVEFKLKHC